MGISFCRPSAPSTPPPNVALVTGGASGMGRILATRLAQRGTKVAILDVDEAMLQQVTQELDSHVVVPFRCDVTDMDAVQKVVQEVETTLGPIDLVAPAAAIMPAQSIHDMDAAVFSKVMEVNYSGVVNVVKSVMTSMVERGSGQIVLFGSVAGVVPMQRFSAYGATKAAINLFGEVLHEELKGSGVHVLTVRPSAVDTPLIDQATKEGGISAIREAVEKGTAADPEDIIDAVEKALTEKKSVLYPNMEAQMLQVIRRTSASLMWWIVNQRKDDK